MNKSKTKCFKAKELKDTYFLLWLHFVENGDLSQLGDTEQFPSQFRTQT